MTGTGIKMQYGDLHNVGVVIEDLNPFLVKRIQRVTHTFKDQFKDTDATSQHLHKRISGYDLDHELPEDLKTDIEQVVRKLIDAHEHQYHYTSRIFNFMTDTVNDEIQFKLERMWVNVQRKGEFLPVHNHSGVYSFVIWTDVPFNIEDETRASPNPTTDKNRAGYFQFLYTDTLGKINTLNLPVDKKWEGRLCVFPAELNHQVYPFYSSDDVRISIAGNFRVISNVKL